MKKIDFRELRPDDIEVRPATIKDGKATLLTYIDSRSVVELLDGSVGPYNWNMELTQVGDQMVGRLGIWDEDKQTWVVKSDTGSESNIEAGKGLVSDIYKRCIARWGLQDLYTVPRIVVDDDGYGCKWHVGEVRWNDRRECTYIRLENRFGKTMYEWGEGAEECKPVPNESLKLRKTNDEILKEFCTATKENPEVDKADLLRFYNFYMKKTGTWEGPFKPETLWNRWCETRRN